MDPETIKYIKELRETMEKARDMEFALVAEKEYKNARDLKPIRNKMEAYWEEHFKNKSRG